MRIHPNVVKSTWACHRQAGLARGEKDSSTGTFRCWRAGVRLLRHGCERGRVLCERSSQSFPGSSLHLIQHHTSEDWTEWSLETHVFCPIAPQTRGGHGSEPQRHVTGPQSCLFSKDSLMVRETRRQVKTQIGSAAFHREKYLSNEGLVWLILRYVWRTARGTAVVCCRNAWRRGWIKVPVLYPSHIPLAGSSSIREHLADCQYTVRGLWNNPAWDT
jgi:hypothetical protein